MTNKQKMVETLKSNGLVQASLNGDFLPGSRHRGYGEGFRVSCTTDANVLWVSANAELLPTVTNILTNAGYINNGTHGAWLEFKVAA